MLDAATCAAILRRNDAADKAVLDRLTGHAVGAVCISSVTLAELMYGVEVSRRSAQERAAIDVFLRHVAVLDFPQSAAEHYGMVKMVLELCELHATAEEMLAAAHARSLGMTLVSPSARNLARTPDLSAESW
jgi:tRNA(fMet)-specific endonuclease VapC